MSNKEQKKCGILIHASQNQYCANPIPCNTHTVEKGFNPTESTEKCWNCGKIKKLKKFNGLALGTRILSITEEKNNFCSEECEIMFNGRPSPTKPDGEEPTKVCRECNKTKKYSELVKDLSSKNGVEAWCKDCARKTWAASRNRHRDTAKKRYLKIKDTPSYKKRMRESALRMMKKYPEKYQTRELTKVALKRGFLVKGACEVCGENKVQVHHPDYSKPLLVNWLCRKHHNDKHRKHKEVS